jgi:lipoprotein-anchoring transpeptidase ErfK/SrfK
MEEPPATPDVPQAKAKKPAHLKRWLLISGIVLGSFALLNLGIWGMYHARAYPGVKVGGSDVGNLDQAAITNRLNSDTATYKLTVSVSGQPQQVSAEDLNLSLNQQNSAKSAISEGKGAWLPLYGLVYSWKNGVVDVQYTLDETKLNQITTKLAGSGSAPATDAKVVIEGETVKVEADKPGQGIDVVKLASLIKQSIARGTSQASIDEGVTQAAVTTDEATVMAATVRKTLALPISIKAAEKSFNPGAAEVGKWITVAPADGKLILGINQDAVKAYIDGVAGQVDVKAVNKQINMVNGVVKTVSEGKNGSALDKTALAALVSKAVTTGADTAIVGVMAPVAFKNITNNTVDLEGKYIEINLSRQHLWAYDNKQLVFESPITSGATGAGFATIQGLFSVKAKQTNRNLNGYGIGYDYNVFVNYWMPFSGNYGMHDASWRTAFGGQDYYYGGSHGCVNLPAATAAWVYNFVLVGTPVWVHS